MNITLSVDRRLVERARRLAESQGTSLNQMIRQLLEKATETTSTESMLGELESLWESSVGDSGGRRWSREDLYDRPVLR